MVLLSKSYSMVQYSNPTPKPTPVFALFCFLGRNIFGGNAGGDEV